MSFISSLRTTASPASSVTTAAFTTSGNNRLLLIGIGYGGASSTTRVTSCSRLAQSASIIGGNGAYGVPYGDHNTELWAIAAPNTGSGALTVNFSQSLSGIVISTSVFDNAPQSAWTVQTTTYNRTSGSSSQVSATLTMPAAGDLYGFVWSSHTGSATYSGTPAWVGSVTSHAASTLVGGYAHSQAGHLQNVSGSQTITWNSTLTGGSSAWGTMRLIAVAVQGAGVSGSATGSFGGSWTIRNAQASALAGSWTIRSSAGASFGGSWSIRSAQTASFSGAWSIRSSQSATLQGAWSIRNSTSAAFSGAWTIASAATGDATGSGEWGDLEWGDQGGDAVATSATAAFSGSWTIRNSTAANATWSWTIRNASAKSFDGSWTIRNSATAVFGGLWTIQSGTAASASFAGSWSIRNAASSSLIGGWTIRSNSASTFNGSWSIRNQASAQFAGSWSIESDIIEVFVRSRRVFVSPSRAVPWESHPRSAELVSPER